MGLLKLVNSEEHLSNETSKKQKKQSNKQHVSIINKLKPKNVRKLWKTWYANYKNKMKKNNDFRKKMKGEEKKTRLMRQTSDILPFKQIHDDYILLEDGAMDIFQVDTQNVHALNEVDLEVLLLNRTQFLRSYFPSFKEVILNFPTNAERQRQYWEKKKQQASNKTRLEYINQKLFEFDYLESERYNREFFLFVYADTQDNLLERKHEMMQGMQNSFPLHRLSRQKKEQVLFLLNNQNTKL